MTAADVGIQPSTTRPAPGTLDRFTWAVAGGVLVLVLLALGGVALLQRRAVPADLSRPEGVVRAYVEAIDTGRADRAWDLLATPARGDVSREEFLRRAAALSQRPPSRVAIESVVVEDEVARVEVSRIFAVEGPIGAMVPSARATVRLIREQGAWRIEVPPDPYLISRDPRAEPRAP